MLIESRVRVTSRRRGGHVEWTVFRRSHATHLGAFERTPIHPKDFSGTLTRAGEKEPIADGFRAPKSMLLSEGNPNPLGEEKYMGTYSGWGPVDSSDWDHPVTYTKDGERHPEPAKWRNGKRLPTPDPYTEDNKHVRRNFGRKTT